MIINRTLWDVWWSFWPAASKRQRDGREVSSSLWFVLDGFFSFIWCGWSDHHEHLLPRYGLGIVAEEYVEGQMIDIEVELTAYHQVGCKTSNNSGANITYKCLHKTIQHNIEYEETYLQGYFEFRLCPHNTRRRPAQQARSKQSQNLKQTNTLNVKQENKINVSIDL